jgi:hypothetical protein
MRASRHSETAASSASCLRPIARGGPHEQHPARGCSREEPKSIRLLLDLVRAWTTRATHRKKFGYSIPLSDNYHALISLFFQIEEAVHYGEKLTQGGWVQSAEWLASHVGLVPEAAWKPKINFTVGESAPLFAELEGELARYQIQLALLHENGESDTQAWELATKTKSRLFGILREKAGNPPSRFEIDGKNYTPHSFAQTILPKGKTSSVFVIRPVRTGFVRPGTFAMDNYQPMNSASLIQLFPTTKNRIFTKKSPSLEAIVHISTPMVNEFIDERSGVMSISAKGATPEIAKETPHTGAHAMLVTGVYIDAKSTILGYRIQNSWGKWTGENGYYFMDRDYFDVFASDVRLIRTPRE